MFGPAEGLPVNKLVGLWVYPGLLCPVEGQVGGGEILVECFNVNSREDFASVGDLNSRSGQSRCLGGENIPQELVMCPKEKQIGEGVSEGHLPTAEVESKASCKGEGSRSLGTLTDPMLLSVCKDRLQ